MKKFRLTICVLLTVISMLLNTVCAFASTPKNSGHLDSIDGNKVSGWACLVLQRLRDGGTSGQSVQKSEDGGKEEN